MSKESNEEGKYMTPLSHFGLSLDHILRSWSAWPSPRGCLGECDGNRTSVRAAIHGWRPHLHAFDGFRSSGTWWQLTKQYGVCYMSDVEQLEDQFGRSEVMLFTKHYAWNNLTVGWKCKCRRQRGMCQPKQKANKSLKSLYGTDFYGKIIGQGGFLM